MEAGDAIEKVLKSEMVCEFLNDTQVPAIFSKPLAEQVLEQHQMVAPTVFFPVDEKDPGECQRIFDRLCDPEAQQRASRIGEGIEIPDNHQIVPDQLLGRRPFNGYDK
jgi:hypothetical protein